jgi:4'-phosphopantetheinyl transferase
VVVMTAPRSAPEGPAEPPAVEVTTVATAGATSAHIARLRSLLSADEGQRADRFVRSADRDLYTVGHALVRLVLSRHGSTAAPDWRFDVGAYGCPSVVPSQAGTPPLAFNLSHTDGLVAVAVTRGRRVGVDVERVDRAVTDGIAERHFAAAEVAGLRALPPPAQARAFFDYWTLKEAYIKARGMGLAIPLDAFAFRLDPPRPPTIAFVDGFDDRPGRWRFRQAWPTPDHRLALAVECQAGDVAVHLVSSTPEALAALVP